MKKILLIFSIILAFATTSKSQVSNIHLSFGELGVTYHDTLDFNQTISFSFWIRNTGNIPLESLIEINLINSNYPTDVHWLGEFADSDTILSPGDSIYITCWDYISPQAYIGGDNIVVIWPSAVTPLPFTSDEFVGGIFVNTTTQLNSILKEQDFSIYPNPISERSVLTNINNKEIISITFYDILGNIIYREENMDLRQINIKEEEFNTGIYFVEITSGENKIIKKIIIK
ncbi:MAG: T9SS type A sorting domain-containing protein [Flavobacteriales bacterium]|tara:strand:+ start:295 stop:984 length:690 start_codon:yes stop_codon:yes gene_type:complete